MLYDVIKPIEIVDCDYQSDPYVTIECSLHDDPSSRVEHMAYNYQDLLEMKKAYQKFCTQKALDGIDFAIEQLRPVHERYTNMHEPDVAQFHF